jgi:peptide/nickel transport system permease protein
MAITIASDEPEYARSPSLVATFSRRLLTDPVTLVAVLYLGLLCLVAIFAPLIAPNDPLAQSILQINLPPSRDHWLGTDQFGRDVLSRIIYGSRASLELGLISPLLAALGGSIIGMIGGYFGGIVDRVVGRLIDLLLSFPILLLGIIVAAALGPGFWNLVMALVLAFAPRFARIARASTLSIRNEPFVEAAVAAGVRHPTIIVRHILPNIAGSIAVLITLWISSAIQLEATLSFLGLGTEPPRPSWGNIIRDGLNNLFGSAWPIVSAGFAITLTVLAFNLLGDAVRDVLDPELKE